MTPEQLKKELREFIELSKTITPEKWDDDLNEVSAENGYCVAMGCLEEDAAFIARSRNISPKMAECLLVAVEGLEYVIACYEAAIFEGLNDQLQESEYESGNLRDLVERRLYYSELEAMKKLEQILNTWNS